MISEERLAELEKENAERRRVKDAATPGPWEPDAGCLQCPDEKYNLWFGRGPLTKVVGFNHGEALAMKDGQFIANARNDPVEDRVDELIAEVRMLTTSLRLHQELSEKLGEQAATLRKGANP